MTEEEVEEIKKETRQYEDKDKAKLMKLIKKERGQCDYRPGCRLLAQYITLACVALCPD